MAAGEHFRRPCSTGHASQACFPHPPGPRCVDPSRIQLAQGCGCPSPSFQKCDGASAHMPWETTGAKRPPLGVRGSGGVWLSPRQPHASHAPVTMGKGKVEFGGQFEISGTKGDSNDIKNNKYRGSLLPNDLVVFDSPNLAPESARHLLGKTSPRTAPRAGKWEPACRPPGCVCPDPEQQLRLEGCQVGRRRDREPQGSRTLSQLDSSERELTSGEATRLVQVTSVFGAGKGTAPSASNSELLFFPQLFSLGNH